MRTIAPSVVLPLVLLGCHTAPATPQPVPDPVELEVAAALDRSVDPCTDFYAFACGGWEEANPLPPDEAVIVRGFTTIADRNEALLRDILEGLAADPPDDEVKGKLGRFYGACMDLAAIDARGAEPVRDDLARLDEVTDLTSFARTAGWLQGTHGSSAVFGFWVGADEKNPDLNILNLSQPRLGLPDRTYYLDEEQAELRDAYRGYLTTLFELVGEPSDEAAAHAEQVVALETELARISWERERMRDTTLTYNKLDRTGLEEIAPGFDWDVYFAEVGRPELTHINVVTPSYFEALPSVLASAEPEALRSTLRAHLLRGAAEHLSAEFRDADFAFYGRTLSGQPEPQPRWKTCVSTTDDYLGDLLGQVYVERAFAGESKEVALDMIDRIEGAFERSLPELAWMDEPTRAAAIEKARAITNKIGYPDRWRDYGAVEVGADHWSNVESASARILDEELGKLEQPVDRSEWFMTPSTVNAYYNPNANEIAFPAGILQPPFYAVDRPMAMNFGAIGMVVGHEITHGFDDQGRAYDGSGRLADWWAEPVVEAFTEQAQCVEDQYASFEAQPGLFLSGKLTLGENIADLGGLKQAWTAWQDYAAEHGRGDRYAGLDPDQLFFVAFAQSWCTVSRPEAEARQVRMGPHSPPRFRVQGAVMNHPAFGEVFACEPGEPMRPENACEVW